MTGLEGSNSLCESCKGTAVLVIGIDFGATHSCTSLVGYNSCAIHHNGEATLTEFKCAGKFPTVYLSGRAGSQRQLLEPGEAIPPSKTPIRNFKLLLPKRSLWENGSEEQEAIWRHVNDTAGRGGLDDALIVLDYLELLWEKAWREARDYLHGGMPNTVKVVVTYPACFESDKKAWSDLKFATECAVFEGTTADVDLMSEHDAALTAALACGPPSLWHEAWAKSFIIVVDCGGMSIDGVFYQLPDPGATSANTDRVFKSMLGGGMWADERLRQRVRDRLRRIMGNDGAEVSLDEAVSRVMSQWRDDLLPKLFGGEHADNNFDAEISPGIVLRISRDDIQAAFAPVIDNIVQVTTSLWRASIQAEKRVRTVFLTGGLSRHPGLIDAVENRLSAESLPPGSVETFENAWKAVAIGAALKDLPAAALRRISREDRCQ